MRFIVMPFWPFHDWLLDDLDGDVTLVPVTYMGDSFSTVVPNEKNVFVEDIRTY